MLNSFGFFKAAFTRQITPNNRIFGNRTAAVFCRGLLFAAVFAWAASAEIGGNVHNDNGWLASAWAGASDPVANAGLDRTITLGATVVLDGTGSNDPYAHHLLSFAWSITSKPAGSLAALSSTTASRPNLTADLAGDYVVQLLVSQGGRVSSADQVVISTTASAPLANAGLSREISASELVQLDASRSSDVDGDVLSYAWSFVTKPAGSVAALSDAAALRPTFSADLAGDYVLRLTVTDAGGLTDTSDVTYSTNELKAVPASERNLVAAVGDIVVLRPGAFLQLENDPDHQRLYWSLTSRPAGSSAAISGFKDIRPTVTLDVAGTYVAQVRVMGEGQYHVAGTLTITTANLAAKADAGADQTVTVGALVNLDGSKSTDLNGDLISYRWALTNKPAGSSATLDDASAVRPAFTADQAGDYVVQLLVDDGSGALAAADTVVISTSASRPAANAGEDQLVAKSALAKLDGSGSGDADGQALVYKWTMLERPNGNGGILSDGSLVDPTFVAHKSGDYLAQLQVFDGAFWSYPDTVLVTTGNRRPEAVPGNNVFVMNSNSIQLDGSASYDANGDAITYQWSLLHRPAGSGASLTNATTASPSIAPDVVGVYVVQLIVDDGIEPSLPQTVIVELVNQQPVAQATISSPTTFVGTAVTVDGSTSFDPDGGSLTYIWTVMTAPVGSTAQVTPAGAAIASFNPDVAGDYVLKLVVSDGVLTSQPVLLSLNAILPNQPPVLAVIGDQLVALGNKLTLNL